MAVTQTIVIVNSNATWADEDEASVDINHIAKHDMSDDDWEWLLHTSKDSGMLTSTRTVNEAGNEFTIVREWTDEGWGLYQALNNGQPHSDRKKAFENHGPEWSLTETHT